MMDQQTLKACIEQIKHAIPIEEIIGEDVELTKQGNDLRGKHPDYASNSGKSLVVTPSKGLWNYFGEDEKQKGGGDHFDWLMSYRKMIFKEALSYLSRRVNIPLPNMSEEERQHQEQIYHDRKEIYPLLQAAAMFYHSQITEDHRRHILDKWGLTSETIDKLLIGYAPPGGHTLFKTMQTKGYTRELLLKSGLFLGIKKEIPFDFFQGRYIFPYWNNHSVVYFIGRKTDQTPVNEFETYKYKKLPVHSERHEFISPVISNEWFYGEDEIIGAKEILLTEGVTDCCSANQNNIPCISPVTVQFSKKDYPKILRLCQKAEKTSICNDNEKGAVGIKGALTTAKFLDSKGIQVKIVTLPRPEGVDKIDVADYLKDHSKDDLKNLFGKALSYWKFRIDILSVPDDDLEKIKVVKNFVETELLDYDELAAGALIKGILKTKFNLDPRETKALIGQCDKAIKAQKKLSRTGPNEDKPNESAIIEKNGRLYKIKKSNNGGDPDEIPITSFIVEPIVSTSIVREGEILSVKIKTKYKEFEIDLPSDCWSAVPKILKLLPGKETIFTGNLVDLQHLRLFLSTKKMPHKLGLRTSGFYEGKFVTEEGALSSNGTIGDVVYKNEVPTHCQLISTEPATKEDLAKIKDHIDCFNVKSVVLPVLGWIIACFFKVRISKASQQLGRGNGFPLINIQGEAGAGKTCTMCEVKRICVLDNEPKSISELTEFTIMKLLDGSNTIPAFLEENKLCFQDRKQQAMISTMIRSTYNCFEGERGRQDQTTRVYRYQAPVVMIGETGFTESALLDRFIVVQLSKKDSSPYMENFQNLRKLPLEKLGRSILERSLSMDDAAIKTILEGELKAIDKALTDRPSVNAAICRFGLRILQDVLDKKFDLSIVDKAVLEGISEDGMTKRKSAVDKILEAMCLMAQPGNKTDGYDDLLRPKTDYCVTKELLKLYTSRMYPKFRKWAKAYGFEGDLLPENTFKKQVQKEGYFVSIGSMKIGGMSRRGLALNIDAMKAKGLEIYEPWTPQEKEKEE